MLHSNGSRYVAIVDPIHQYDWEFDITSVRNDMEEVKI
jgi:hypothetical protein